MVLEGRKRASRLLKRAAHPDPLALISRAPLQQGIIFNQLFVSMPRMWTEGCTFKQKRTTTTYYCQSPI